MGGVIFSFLYWGFGFLRMGTTGITAQAYGKRDFKKSSLILLRSLFSAVFLSFLIFLLAPLIKEVAFLLLSGSMQVETLAKKYFDIRIYDVFAVLALYSVNGWLMGMQNAKYTMILVIFTNLLNVILDAFFIYKMGMDVDGVALGTVISQYAGAVLGFFLIFKKYRDKFFGVSFREIFHIDEMLLFFRLNSDIFIRTISLIFAFAFFTNESAKFGDDVLAANTILMQIWTVFAYGIDGFAFAAESLVGKYLSKSQKELRELIRRIFIWGFGLGGVFSIAIFLFPQNILSFFTNNEKVLQIALGYIIYTILAPLINSFSYLWDGIYLGASRAKALRNSMLIAVFLIYLPLYFLTRSYLGGDSLWIAMVIFMVARGFLLFIQAEREIFNTHQ